MEGARPGVVGAGDTRIWDVLLVAVLLIVAQFEIWVAPIFQTGLPGPRLPLAVLATLAIVPLVWRRARPLVVLVAVGLGMFGVGIVGSREQAAFPLVVALLVAVFSLAAHAPAREAVIGGAFVVVVGIGYSLATFADGDGAIDLLVPYLFLGGAWIAGREVWRQRAAREMAIEHAQLVERLRETETATALVEERRRIARELHDVVSHGISVMGVQAAAARSRLAPEQVDARDALLTVERIGRESLAEMHLMLGVLRGSDEASELAVAGLDALPDLVEEARQGGLRVAFESSVPPGAVSRVQSLSIYRVVQEALTNARKHGATSAAVAVSCDDDRVVITVTDDGPGPRPSLRQGHGLLGVRERVGIHGGHVEWGRDGAGGFRLAARMPLEAPGR